MVTKSVLIWIGATLEISALGAGFAGYLAGGAAAVMLITLAVLLAFNGASLQLFSSEVQPS